MSETRPTQEQGDKKYDMNNFHRLFYQHLQTKGGDITHHDQDSPFLNEYHARKKEIHKAIDQLLATEFSHLDIKNILKRIDTAQETFLTAARSGKYNNPGEVRVALKDILEDGHKAYEELRPLFEKLISMGFTASELSK